MHNLWWISLNCNSANSSSCHCISTSCGLWTIRFKFTLQNGHSSSTLNFAQPWHVEIVINIWRVIENSEQTNTVAFTSCSSLLSQTCVNVPIKRLGFPRQMQVSSSKLAEGFTANTLVWLALAMQSAPAGRCHNYTIWLLKTSFSTDSVSLQKFNSFY